MRSKSIVFSSVIIAVVAIAAIAGALAYASQTQNTDNEIDSVYSLFYLTDANGDGVAPSALVTGLSGDYSAGQIKTTSSTIYINYRDTQSQNAGSVPLPNAEFIQFVTFTIEEWTNAQDMMVTLNIGGSSATGYVDEDGHLSVYGVTYATFHIDDEEFKSGFRAEISITAKALTAKTGLTTPSYTMTSMHTDQVANPSIIVGNNTSISFTESSATANVFYNPSIATGSYALILTIKGTFNDAVVEGDDVIVTVADTGMIVGSKVLADHKIQLNIPLPLTGGYFSGDIVLDVYSSGAVSTLTINEISTKEVGLNV